MNHSRSETLFAHAKTLIPGGVNSPVRAFRAVGGNPVFIREAQGAYITDEDDNRYIELINSWGPMILGHAHPIVEEAVREAIGRSLSFGAPTRKEVEMAELILSMVPSMELVRMVNSGTEATMSAIRVARGYTGKNKIVKFEGCYHGHADSFLIAAGSGAATFGVPDSPGVPAGVAADTLTVPYNDLDAVESVFATHSEQIAALIIEPVAGNMGCIAPLPGYLQGLRDLCDKHQVVLIFDEVMTGFRLSTAGAQGLYGVTPDLTTLGKIIGGGMPVGAYGGKKEIMQHVAPSGKVYQAGTLSGNPVAMAAGYALLSHLKSHPSIYETLEDTGKKLEEGLHAIQARFRKCFTINRVGSMITLFFTEQPVRNFTEAKTSDTELFGRYFRLMLEAGVYLAPSQYEALFLSTALGEPELAHILNAHQHAFEVLFA